MVKLHTLAEKDIILRMAFERLANLGISPKWGSSTKPYTDLREECEQLMTDANFVKELDAYLQKHIVLGRASEMFATYIAMAARAKWYEARISFDFRRTPNAFYSIFAPRINEGCSNPAPAHLLTANLQVFSSE